eukprot:TRINITY_DN14718_c0_g1_i1.p1 TRINITY_DN14718_c0_g1~~TRINITY_DN14718_c0_g1_i1.p1  ORF type:complete len:434 (-),score=59.13 TRINITY_DN14718_c0_g1_i1:119-1420(-)
MASPKMFPPKDSFKFILICMIWIGITTLLPWNMFVAVHEYWMYKLRSINETSPSGHDLNDLQIHWGSYLSVSSMAPYVVGLVFTVLCGQRIPLIPRLLSSITVIVLLLLSTVIFARVNTDSWQKGFLAITLITIVTLNLAMSLLQGGMGGLAAGFPSEYMNAMTQGQAIGGVISCLVNIVILAVGADQNTAAFFCFILATLFTGICGVFIAFMTKTEFYRFYHPGTDKNDPEVRDRMMAETPANNTNELLYVFQKTWPWIVGIFINFLVTLSVFPALTSLVSSSEDPKNWTEWNTKYFIPVGCFLLFNIGDYVGRLLAGLIKWPNNASSQGSKIILGASILRIAFIPLFICCNIQPNNRHFTAVLFNSDIVFLIMIFTFALSNGYIGNISLMFGPKMLVTQREQMKAGEVMVASMIIGLCIGAGLSNAWLALI